MVIWLFILNKMIYHIRASPLVTSSSIVTARIFFSLVTRRIEKPHFLASIDKARNILGYKPSHDLEKGLQEAVEWYWGNLK